MEIAQGIRRIAMSVVVTRANGDVDERVVGYCDADPAVQAAVEAAIARGEHILETDLIPHGEMTPIGLTFSGQAVR